MHKRSLFLLLAVCLVVLLVGCGANTSNGNENASESNVTNKENSKEEPKEETTEEPVEISFWAWDPAEEVWGQVIQAFNKLHPNIKVNFTRNPSADYEKKIRVAVQSGQIPDVMAFQFGPMISNYESILEPLEPYFEKSMGKDWKGKFKEFTVREAERLNFKVFPTGVAVTPFIAYDIDMFEKAGAKPPETYEELKAALKKFEEAKLPGVIPRLGFAGGKGSTVTDLYYTIVNQIAPGKLYEADAGTIGFDDPDLVRATQMFEQFYKDNIFQDGNLSTSWNPQLRDMFEKKRQLPMIIVGNWVMGDVANKDKLEMGDRTFGLLPLPVVEGGKASVLVNPDLPLGISKDSKHKEAAWKFVEFMTTGEYQQVLSKKPTFLPVLNDLAPDDSLFKVQSEKDGLKLISDLATDPEAVGGIRFLSHASIENAIFENLQKVATKQITPENAMKEIQKVSESVKR